MELKLPKTWKKPIPGEILGLPAGVVGRWSSPEKIGEWEAQGYVVLEVDSELGKKVKAGFKKEGNMFKVGKTVLMIAREEVKKQKQAHDKKKAMDRLQSASATVDATAKAKGLKGIDATLDTKEVEMTVDTSKEDESKE